MARHRVGDAPRDAVETEWEVFVREAEGAPLGHVGSVSAPSGAAAHERAATLFGDDAPDVWLCPADAVHRYSTHALDDRVAARKPHDDRADR